MTITPGNFNFTIYIGNTLNIVLTWRDSTGALVNLTGYSATLECRYNLTDADPFVTFSVGGFPEIILGDAAGTITLLADTSVTSALTAGLGVMTFR